MNGNNSSNNTNNNNTNIDHYHNSSITTSLMDINERVRQRSSINSNSNNTTPTSLLSTGLIINHYDINESNALVRNHHHTSMQLQLQDQSTPVLQVLQQHQVEPSIRLPSPLSSINLELPPPRQEKRVPSINGTQRNELLSLLLSQPNNMNEQSNNVHQRHQMPDMPIDEDPLSVILMDTDSNHQQERLSESTKTTTPTTSSITIIPSNTPSTLRYYDEGMYMYRTDLHVQLATFKFTAIVTIDPTITEQYNIGQMLIRSMKHADAIRHFESALNVCSASVPQHEQRYHALIVHFISCNIGYCYYCMSNDTIDQSKAWYQSSLEIAKKHNLPVLQIHASQNAILVLELFYNAVTVAHLPITKQESTTATTSSTATEAAGVTADQNPTNIEDALHLLCKCYEAYAASFGIISNETMAIMYNVGRTQALQKDFSSALRTLEQCLHIQTSEISTATSDTWRDMNIAACICCIGQVYHQIGIYDVAVDMYEEYIHSCCHVHSEYGFHPDVAATMLCIADIYKTMGNTKSAVEYCEYVIEHQQSFFHNHDGTDDNNNNNINPTVRVAYEKLGDISIMVGNNYAKALQYYKMCLTMEQEELLMQQVPVVEQYNPTEIPHLLPSPLFTKTNSTILFKIALMQRRLKMYSSAIQVYHILLLIYAHECGSNSLEVAKILSFIGKTLVLDQKYRWALHFFCHELKIQMHHQCYDDSIDSAKTLKFIGLVYYHQQQYDLSEWCFTHSLRMNTRLLGRDCYDNATLWYNMASISDLLNAHDKAITFYKESIRIELLHQQPLNVVLGNGKSNRRLLVHRGSSKALCKLGNLYQRQGELYEALECFHCALGIDIKSCINMILHGDTNNNNNNNMNATTMIDMDDVLLVAKIANVIGNIHLQLANISDMMEYYTASARLLRDYYNITTSNEINQITTSTNTTTTINHYENTSLMINGYVFYYLSRMCPSAAPVA